MDLSKIKAVIFDGDNTLFKVKHSVGFHYHTHFQRYGIHVSAETIDKALPGLWKMFETLYLDKKNDYRTDCAREQRLWKQFIITVLQEYTEAPFDAELIQELYDFFSRAESRELEPGVFEALEFVKSIGLLSALLTNNDQRTKKLMEDIGLSSSFDHIFCACELGYKKPAKECFERVQERLSLKPEELLYIGDHAQQDYDAAVSAGWLALLYGKADGNRERLKDFSTLPLFFESPQKHQ